MARAYFRIVGQDGDGSSLGNAYRPKWVLELRAWVGVGESEQLILAETDDPLSFAAREGVTFAGLLIDVQADYGTLRALVEQAAGGSWSDLMLGEPLRRDEITDEQYALLVRAYPAWAVKVKYKVGDLCSHVATLYEVVQAHTSQADWTPDKVPALFVARSPAGVIPLWVQPTGAHDAYAKGALVIFEGKVYRSLIDANVWSPAVYPAGWEGV